MKFHVSFHFMSFVGGDPFGDTRERIRGRRESVYSVQQTGTIGVKPAVKIHSTSTDPGIDTVSTVSGGVSPDVSMLPTSSLVSSDEEDKPRRRTKDRCMMMTKKTWTRSTMRNCLRRWSVFTVPTEEHRDPGYVRGRG
jgi:hypothetical protein